MIELRNKDQRNEYIKKLWLELFNEEPELEINFIDIGVMNYVYEVKSKNRVIYLKQALEEAKYKAKIGKDLAGIPKERILYECRYIKTIRNKLPPGIELPEILKYDEENNILVMSDVSKGGIVLEIPMLNGNFNEKVAYYLGKFLGISHKKTIGKKIIIRGTEEEDLRNWHIFLNMRTKGILQKGGFPEQVKTELETLYKEVRDKHTFDVVINMDVCPKNLIQRGDGSVGVIDFELSSGVGDPTYDLGFLMGHYLLMAVIKKDKIENAIKAMNQILRGYDEEMQDLKNSSQDRRLIKYAGAVMVYRITGSSPAHYIKVEHMPKIKEIGFHLITNKFEKGFDGVFEFLEKSLTKN